MIISVIILLGALAFGAVNIIKGISIKSEARYDEKDKEREGSRKIVKGVVICLIGLVIAAAQPFALERIDAGNKGLKVNLTGSERGVSNYQYKTGWVIYNSWTEQVKEFPLYQQHIEYADQQVITKGGFSASIKPSFNYSLKPTAVGDMFVNLRLPIKEVEQGWLKNAIVGAVNDVANTWEVDSVFGHRQAFEAAIVNECNLRLSKWFIVSQMRSNIIPPEALQEAIIAKTKSVQQAEASKQQAIAAQADGQRKIAVARADSAETVINASAKAKAMELTQQKLTPLFVEYKKIEKWDGHNSETVLGNGSNTLVNVK
jgi:hypothetical protein